MLKKCIILCGMLSILFILSCEKEENFDPVADTVTEQEDCFFTNECLTIRNRNTGRSENLDAYVDLIMDYFIDNPHEKNKTENKYGIPVWDFVNTSQANGGVLVSLPMVKPNKGHTEAILLVLVNNQLELGFNVMERKKLDKFNKKNKNKAIQSEISRELALIQFLIADKTIFDYTDCSMIDLLVSISSNSRKIESSRTDECYWSWESDEECWSIEVYGTDGNPIGEPMTECETVYDYEIICNGPSVPPTEPEDSNSGNGGNGSNPDPIVIVPYETIITQNLSPCAEEIVNKIKSGDFGNDVLINLLRDIFDKNSDVNITIVESNLDSTTDGLFDISQAQGQPDIGFYFNGTLTINSNFTSTGSKDWILATIIHEMIHGYIGYQRGRVASGFITQDQFNREFPLYSSADNNSDHLTMGYQYVNSIANILKQNNPNLSNAEALSLSRVGLHDTSFWNMALSANEKTEAIHSNDIGRGTNVDVNSKQIKC